MTKGRVHVITGHGKGKTTSALGLALRAAGAGRSVYIGQFGKKGDYSEIRALERLSDRITVEQFGLGRFTNGKPEPEDIEAAQEGLEKVTRVMASDKYDMVVLDEANVATRFGMIETRDLLDLIARKPPEKELIITGRYASTRVLEMADEVSELKARKHYYKKGVEARVGIEK
ncbi:MAG: cob(I)yrinic acid a,c-diamide adenosyltransferase [Desulfobacterales bacterium]|nr:cob(I)yrinic acid a,c-diamide adenosyltransferase [Desulfobacterales bacterium]